MIPRGVRDVVRSRVAHLPDTTVEVAGGEAVLGQHFALAVLGQVLGMDGGTLLEQIQPAIAAGLVVEDGQGLGRYRFSHALVNETIYDDLAVGRRAAMHLSPDLRSSLATEPETVRTWPRWPRTGTGPCRLRRPRRGSSTPAVLRPGLRPTWRGNRPRSSCAEPSTFWPACPMTKGERAESWSYSISSARCSS